MYAEDGSNDFIAVGDAFTDPVFEGFRLVFEGLDSDDAREDISIDVAGNDKMTIDFDNWQGLSITNFEWLNNETNAILATQKSGQLMFAKWRRLMNPLML
jgi:hypothetical protein